MIGSSYRNRKNVYHSFPFPPDCRRRRSVCRASGLVLTGKPEVMPTRTNRLKRIYEIGSKSEDETPSRSNAFMASLRSSPITTPLSSAGPVNARTGFSGHFGIEPYVAASSVNAALAAFGFRFCRLTTWKPLLLSDARNSRFFDGLFRLRFRGESSQSKVLTEPGSQARTPHTGLALGSCLQPPLSMFTRQAGFLPCGSEPRDTNSARRPELECSSLESDRR
jgi:hypothetical protein